MEAFRRISTKIIESRIISHNPLYKAWKAKSFTDGDITLHFILFNILNSPEICLSLPDIIQKADDEYLSEFDDPIIFDESPMAYKSMDEIIENIAPTAEIIEHIRPVYNFKAAE